MKFQFNKEQKTPIVDSSHEFRQSRVAYRHSHSQDTFGNMEHSPNLDQNEIQHNLSTGIILYSHSSLSHSPHQSQPNPSEDNHFLPLAT